MEDVKNFIITKHENDTSFYKNKIMTKQIGDIKISEEAINDKKALIVTVAFITGFILSIFLLFFIQFIQSIKKSLKLFFIVFSPDFVAFLIKKVRIPIIKALRLFLSHFLVTHVIIVHVCKKKNKLKWLNKCPNFRKN